MNAIFATKFHVLSTKLFIPIDYLAYLNLDCISPWFLPSVNYVEAPPRAASVFALNLHLCSDWRENHTGFTTLLNISSERSKKYLRYPPEILPYKEGRTIVFICTRRFYSFPIAVKDLSWVEGRLWSYFNVFYCAIYSEKK